MITAESEQLAWHTLTTSQVFRRLRQGVLLILLTLAYAVMNLQQEGKAAAPVAALSRAGALPLRRSGA